MQDFKTALQSLDRTERHRREKKTASKLKRAPSSGGGGASKASKERWVTLVSTSGQFQFVPVLFQEKSEDPGEAQQQAIGER